MTENQQKGQSSGEQQPGFGSDSLGDTTPRQPRREPVFSGFDEEDEYEEPDRDTDLASAYREDDIDDYPLEELEEDPEEVGEEFPEPAREDIDEELPEEDGWQEPEAEEDEEWQEDYQDEYEESASRWPLGLIAVAALALILLAAGGYGVIQQRAATQEEIRMLRAQLATAASPAEVTASNDALRETRRKNVELSMAVESLKLENRRLADTMAGLEAQLEAQQKALAQPAPAPKPAAAPKPAPAKPKPVATSAPATTPEPAATARAGGDWFVNFGSYSQREMAESWAAKLKPTAGNSTVTTGTKDGKTFYRVRIVDLQSKESADKVARQLESQYGLSKLWVGK